MRWRLALWREGADGDVAQQGEWEYFDIGRARWLALLGVLCCLLLLATCSTVYRDTLTRGFSHFVTSMTAPVASGWSGCRVGLAPTGKRRLSTAHPRCSRRRPIYFASRDSYLETNTGHAAALIST